MKYRVIKKTWKRMKWYEWKMVTNYQPKYAKGYRRDLIKMGNLMMNLPYDYNRNKVFGSLEFNKKYTKRWKGAMSF